MGDMNIDKLKEAAEKATPGPWHVDHVVCVRTPGDGDSVAVAVSDRTLPRGQSKHNAAFIAAADPTTILALIERLEALEDEVKDMTVTEPTS